MGVELFTTAPCCRKLDEMGTFLLVVETNFHVSRIYVSIYLGNGRKQVNKGNVLALLCLLVLFTLELPQTVARLLALVALEEACH